MIDTSQFNAWTVVAAGVGGVVLHAYHAIVNAGGLKKILCEFWHGPSPSAPQVTIDKVL